jgi:SAM-dependent methyltransferase
VNRHEYARKRIEERVWRDSVGAPPPPLWERVKSLFVESGFASRVIRKRLHLPITLDTEDRRVLEQIILPYYAQAPRFKTILFVGCGPYTVRYRQTFFPTADYWTVDACAETRRYGANRHVVAPLEQLSRHFPERFFDLIVCNGVYGWGLDTLAQCEAAFSQCFTCGKENGHLVFGWDDLPERTPVPLDQVASLRRFSMHLFSPLGTWRYVTDTPYRHTYDFYRRPADTH